jgi:hypothetical protein
LHLAEFYHHYLQKTVCGAMPSWIVTSIAICHCSSALLCMASVAVPNLYLCQSIQAQKAKTQFRLYWSFQRDAASLFGNAHGTVSPEM